MPENYPYLVRGADEGDANQIIDIDIKSFEDSWTAEKWAEVGRSHEYAISVATCYGSIIGSLVMQRPDENGGVEISRIAVKSQHRRKQVSLHLLAAAVSYAQQKFASHLFIIVPESSIYSGPESLLPWLHYTGFTAVKPFIKNRFTSYGEAEDGVKFIAPITKRTPL